MFKSRIANAQVAAGLTGTTFCLLFLTLLVSDPADAQQVFADGTTLTAAGVIDMGSISGDAGIALRAKNGGVIESFSPLTIITRGSSAIGAQALSGARIDLFDGTTIHTTGYQADGIVSSGVGSLVTATETHVLTEDVGYGLIAGSKGSIQMTDSSVEALVGTGVASFSGGSVRLTSSTVKTGSGIALWIDGIGSTVTGDGLDVTATAARGALVSQGTLSLTDSSINSSSIGIQTGSAATVILNDTSVSTTGNSAYGVYLSGGSQLSMSGGSAVGTAGTNAYGVYLTGDSKLMIDGGAISTSGAGARAIYGGPGTNTATLFDAQISAAQSSAILAYGSTAVFNVSLVDSSVIGNPAALEIGSGASLNLSASGTEITGSALTASGSTSNVSLTNGTLWSMTGNSTITNLTNNASEIDFSPPSGNIGLLASYKTLTVTNYTGNGGVLSLNTDLAGDGAPSDRLIVNGGVATGTSLLKIRDAGGGGALTTGDGILVVDAQNGASTPASAFALDGEARGGAYDYRLYKAALDGSDADDWFLRSTFTVGPNPGEPTIGPEFPLDPPSEPLAPGTYPIIGPELATYATVQPTARTLGLSSLGMFEERVGGQQTFCVPAEGRKDSADASKVRTPDCPVGFRASSAWARVYGQHVDDHYRSFADPRSSGSLGGFQAGVDLWGGEYWPGHTDTAGVYLGFGAAHVDVDGLVTNEAATDYELRHTGRVNLNAWSAGAYLTHIGPGGWYLDAVLQGTLYDGSTSTDYARLDTKGSGFLASLEGGYPIPIPALGSGFVLEPQAQIVWQHTDFDDKNDGLGNVALGDTSGASGRVGIKAAWTIVDGAGKTWQPYLKADCWQDWSGGSNVVYSGTDIVPLASSGRRVQLGAGITAIVRNNLSLFAKADYQFAVGSTESRDGISATAGLRYRW